MNFNLVNADTDSISIQNPNGENITEEERSTLLKDLNSRTNGVVWEDDGFYQTVIVFKAKTYVLFDGKTIKIKGSALKSSTLETGLRQFIDDIVHSILNDKDNYLDIYNSYIRRVCCITDKEEMKLFSSKKALSKTTFESERTNETKIVAALEGSEYVIGDRVWVYYDENENLVLVENFDGCYDKTRLIEKVWRVSQRFSDVIKTEFPKYHLKKNRVLWENILK